MIRILSFYLLCLSAWAPQLQAQNWPDLPTFYKAASIEGYIKFAGERFDLPLKSLRAALLKDGYVIVTDNRIPIGKANWSKVLENLKFKGITGSAVASGPSDVVFKETRLGYRGRAKRPLVIVQHGKYHFVKVTVTMRTNLET